MAIQNWSTTAATNATQPGINWAEGMPPSDVNNSARQMMADVATWFASAEWLPQADTPTYVSATQFTIPGNKTAVYSVGRRVQATGAGYTIKGLISASAYTSLTTVTVVWDSGSLDNTVASLAIGILQDVLNFLVPAGKLDDFAGTSAPAGWLVCDGSAISRTTYSRLFTAIGTTWGAGDGSTTFNVPNLSRKVTVGSGGTGTGTLANTVGATGGEEAHALTTAELAAHNHGVTDPGHVHTVSDPGHAHSMNSVVDNLGPNLAGHGFGATGSGQLEIANNSTNAASTGIGINSATTGITTNNNGSGTAHNNMQPSAVVLKCIKY